MELYYCTFPLLVLVQVIFTQCLTADEAAPVELAALSAERLRVIKSQHDRGLPHWTTLKAPPAKSAEIDLLRNWALSARHGLAAGSVFRLDVGVRTRMEMRSECGCIPVKERTSTLQTFPGSHAAMGDLRTTWW
jgi:hypothetical protein